MIGFANYKYRLICDQNFRLLSPSLSCNFEELLISLLRIVVIESFSNCNCTQQVLTVNGGRQTMAKPDLTINYFVLNYELFQLIL
ncbi:hypothetical protein pb186bvf_011717 [Paramecium bursaria]